MSHSLALRASKHCLGRSADCQARSSARAARYRSRPPCRATSRLTVDGARPSRAAIDRKDSPDARSPRDVLAFDQGQHPTGSFYEPAAQSRLVESTASGSTHDRSPALVRYPSRRGRLSTTPCLEPLLSRKSRRSWSRHTHHPLSRRLEYVLQRPIELTTLYGKVAQLPFSAPGDKPSPRTPPPRR